MEDDLRWKTKFGGRRPSGEDDLLWKTTFCGRWPLVEVDLRWILACCLVCFAAFLDKNSLKPGSKMHYLLIFSFMQFGKIIIIIQSPLPGRCYSLEYFASDCFGTVTSLHVWSVPYSGYKVYTYCVEFTVYKSPIVHSIHYVQENKVYRGMYN